MTRLLPTKDDTATTAPIFPPVSYKQLAAALFVGLALRLFFVAHLSSYSGDTKFYTELARNWLDHGVYGLFVHGQLLPVDMRMPGYPTFLTAIYAVLGRADKTVMIVQAVLDLATCIFAALIAARLAPALNRTLAATAALWMAALCPFTSNYSAIVLTEVLGTFLTTLGLLLFVYVLEDPLLDRPLRSFDRRSLLSACGWFLVGGVLVGVGTLVRPEAPLLLVAVGLVLSIRWRRRADRSKLVLAVSWMAVGLLLPLMPWAVRNARTMGRIEYLAPRYAETRGDFVPRGFFAWTQTWMVRYGDAYLAPWKLGKAPIQIETLPNSAFDSAAERVRVGELLSRYNSDLIMTPMLDQGFAVLARERAARHPLRTYLLIPVFRAWMMWFTPRIELLPYSGKIWPPSQKRRDNPWDFGVTLGYAILDCVYLGLAVFGAWRCRSHPAVAMLIAFVVIRTAFLTQLQTVEPRYVMVCFPALLALGALAWALPAPSASAARRPSLLHTPRASEPTS